MDLTAVILVEIVYAVASLVLISAGLAVVFGMMKVINLAHGEFMMLGGYATITAVRPRGERLRRDAGGWRRRSSASSGWWWSAS